MIFISVNAAYWQHYILGRLITRNLKKLKNGISRVTSYLCISRYAHYMLNDCPSNSSLRPIKQTNVTYFICLLSNLNIFIWMYSHHKMSRLTLNYPFLDYWSWVSIGWAWQWTITRRIARDRDCRPHLIFSPWFFFTSHLNPPWGPIINHIPPGLNISDILNHIHN